MSGPSLKITTDNTKELLAKIAKMKNDTVLVGIPQSEDSRQETGIGNAALLFINNFGSPVNNIPARPVMQIGIKNAQPALESEYKKAIQESLKSGLSALSRYYNRIGIIASNSIKNVINDQDGIEGPSHATLIARKALGFNGDKALIVSGQMRNAITYIVKE